MHEHRHARRAGDLHQRGHVILMAMHAAGRHQAHDVDRALGAFGFINQREQHGAPRQAAIFDGDVDARQILRHDAAGADIHVTDFGIAHLALGQAHGIAAGFQQGMRTGGQEPGVVGCGTLGDGIVRGGVGAPAPAVENAEQSGAFADHGGKIGSPAPPVHAFEGVSGNQAPWPRAPATFAPPGSPG